MSDVSCCVTHRSSRIANTGRLDDGYEYDKYRVENDVENFPENTAVRHLQDLFRLSLRLLTCLQRSRSGPAAKSGR